MYTVQCTLIMQYLYVQGKKKKKKKRNILVIIANLWIVTNVISPRRVVLNPRQYTRV